MTIKDKEERKAFVLEKRKENWTLEKIGKVLGLTRERVRQIEGDLNPNSWRYTETHRARKYWIKRLMRVLEYHKNLSRLTGIRSGSRDRLRETVRIRDNHTCKICGKVWVKGERRFDVHHLDERMESIKNQSYDRANTDKMITLCHKCHLRLVHILKRTFKIMGITTTKVDIS